MEHINWIYILDLIRLIAYAATSIGAFVLAVDDFLNGRRSDIAWVTFSLQYLATIAIFAMDLSGAVAWMEQRYLLTPFAIVGAIAVPYVAFARIAEHRRQRRESKPLNGGYHELAQG